MIRTLAAALATSTCIVALATPAAAQTREYNIPAGSLKSALDAYVRQSGRQVVYRADQVRSARSPGTRGQQSPEAALAAILAGSGFTTRADGNLVAIVRTGNGSASAQSGSGEATAGSAAADDESAEIIVTGSRVRGAAPASPVSVIARDDIDRSGASSVAEVLQTLPQNFGGSLNVTNFGASGSQAISNPGGAASASLRGLGADATLILFDGHRIAKTGFTNASDASAIPLIAVERVEVLTDGASAVYGSDAIGGVINFVLKKRFDGATLSATAGLPTRGHGIDHQLGGAIGQDWGNGSALVSYQYADQQNLDARNREFSQTATSPTDLVPNLQSHSAALFIRQDVGAGVSLFADGFYNHRRVNQNLGNFRNENTDESYAAVIGGSISLSGDWTANFEISRAEDNTTQNSYNLPGSPGDTPSITLYKNVQSSGEVYAGGSLFALPAGDVKMAAGAGYRHERSSNFTPSNTSSVSGGSRNIAYLYGELIVPILESGGPLPLLEGSLAGRFEHYSDVGETVNPKLGLIFRPVSGLSLKGSWGTSFRAPPLTSLFAPRSEFLFRLSDPTSPTGSTVSLITGGGNPNLNPEKSESWTLGAEFAPPTVPGLRLSATYFSYDFKGKILNPVTNLNLALVDSLYAPYVTRNPSLSEVNAVVASATTFRNFTFPPATLADVRAIVFNDSANVSRWKASGIDIAASYAWDAANGRFEIDGSATRLINRQQLIPGSAFARVSGTVFNPPTWKARVGVSYDNGPWGVSVFGNYRSSLLNGVDRIGSNTTFDGQLRYTVAENSGPLGKFTFAFSVINMFDRDPPRIPDTTGFYAVGYDSANDVPLGRVIRLRVTKTF